jgi:tetratricopeptide (TPR) repeat protein
MRLGSFLIVGFLVLAAGAGGVYVAGLRHFNTAQAALEKASFEEAAAAVEQCLRFWPRSYRAHLLAARIARRRQAYEAADRHLADCVRLQGKTEAATLESMLVQVQQGHATGVEDGLYRMVERNSPDAAAILEALAEGYATGFQTEKTLGALNELLNRQPANVSALLLRGKIWEGLNKDEDALQDLSQAVAHQPGSDQARLRLAQVLARLGRIGEAAAHYQCLHERQPHNSEVAVGLARCLQDLAELEQATQLLDTVLASHPDDVAALLERGRVAVRQADLENAEIWLGKAVQLAPFHVEAHLVLHTCLEAEHKRTEADKVRDVLKRLESDSDRLETLMATVLVRPHDISLHCEIGISLLRNGREEEGLRWLKRALQQDPGNVRAQAALLEHERRGAPAGQNP